MAERLLPDGNGWLPELFDDDEWRSLVRSLRLPPRQAQIARLTCRGCSNRQIALRLAISEHTVHTHLQALFGRLEVHERLGVPVRLVLAHRELSNGDRRSQ
jgi:DNA-binding NarL/FixJ family response regulator